MIDDGLDKDQTARFSVKPSEQGND